MDEKTLTFSERCSLRLEIVKELIALYKRFDYDVATEAQSIYKFITIDHA